MKTARRAVIDVGTNSIKLLVADVCGEEVRPVHEESRQTRLGKGFYQTHQLQPETIACTAEAVWEFAEIAREKESQSIRVIATSAARDAVNPADLTSAIERASGLKTEIISGAREAGWAFQGVATDPELAELPLLLLDVGGGSTEFILGHGAKKHFARSFPLGTVRLLETVLKGAKSLGKEHARLLGEMVDRALVEVKPHIAKAAFDVVVGTGGNIDTLAELCPLKPDKSEKNDKHEKDAR